MKKLQQWQGYVDEVRGIIDNISAGSTPRLDVMNGMESLGAKMANLRKAVRDLPDNSIEAGEEELAELETLAEKAKDGSLTRFSREKAGQEDLVKKAVKDSMKAAGSPLSEAIALGLDYLDKGEGIILQLGEDKELLIKIDKNMDGIRIEAKKAGATLGRMDSTIKRTTVLSVSACIFVFLVLVAIIVLKVMKVL